MGYSYLNLTVQFLPPLITGVPGKLTNVDADQSTVFTLIVQDGDGATCVHTHLTNDTIVTCDGKWFHVPNLRTCEASLGILRLA